MGYDDKLNMTLTDISTLYGRCYSIKFWGELTARDYIAITLSWNYSQDILMYIHEDYNQMGLNTNRWPVSAMSIDLIQGVMMDVYLRREKFRYLPNKENAPCVDDVTYNQAKCVYHWMQKAYLAMPCKKSKFKCILSYSCS